MSARIPILLLAAAAIAVLLGPPAVRMPPVLIWNATASMPRGLYRIELAGFIAPGDLVLARVPSAYATEFAERGYLPTRVPLLKRVAAVAGSLVCRSSMTISIDGVPTAEALVSDSQGRLLPHWSGCRTLGLGEVFLLVPDMQASLDGRYFGVVDRSTILGRAVPLWTW